MKSKNKYRLSDFREICDKIKSFFMFNTKSKPMTLTDLCNKLTQNSENIKSLFNESKF